MKTWEKQLLIGLALVGIIFAFGIVLYIFTSGHPVGGPGVSGYQEKLTIQSASFNSMQNAITLQVQSIKNNVTFNGAIIKDTESAVIYISELSGNVFEGENKTIIANLNRDISSGTYTVTLVSKAGGSFVSPSFNVTSTLISQRINVQNITINPDGKALTVYAQSAGNTSVACKDARIADSEGNTIINNSAVTGGPIKTEMTKLTVTWEANQMTLKPNITYRLNLLNSEGNHLYSKSFFLREYGGLQPMAFTNGTANAVFIEFKATKDLTLSDLKIRTPTSGTESISPAIEMPITIMKNETKIIKFEAQTPVNLKSCTAAFSVSDAGFFLILLEPPS